MKKIGGPKGQVGGGQEGEVRLNGISSGVCEREGEMHTWGARRVCVCVCVCVCVSECMCVCVCVCMC